jgi:hypothetical protein
MTDDLLHFEGPDGEIVELKASESLNRLHFPSFLASRTAIVIGTLKSSNPAFKADRELVSELKAWLRRAVDRQNPGHLLKERRNALVLTVIGIVLAVAGFLGCLLVARYFGFGEIFDSAEGKLSFLALFVGLIMIGVGIRNFIKTGGHSGAGL